MEALDLLNKKVDALLKKYVSLEAENKRLRETIAKEVKTNETLTRKLASLEQGMVSVHLGTAQGGAEERDNMRRQLDTVIGEIDKILNTLND